MEYRTAGESHGQTMVTIVTGVPAGVVVTQEALDADLARRQRGYGRGGRMAIETDRAAVLAGVRCGVTTGAPVAIGVVNRDWENWTDVMAPFGEASTRARLTTPRPGHADLPGMLKTSTCDARDVLERASARETAARVAAGGIARALLAQAGVQVFSWVERIGEATCGRIDSARVETALVEGSDVRCPDPQAAAAMRAAIDVARESGESLGGVFAVAAAGVVPGIGGYADAVLRLDGRLAAAIMSVPAIKAVEIGDGLGSAALPGSAVHDPIVYAPGEGYSRTTNHAGGIEGGMSNGETIVLRASMKPIPTLMRPLRTVDVETHEPADASKERSDVCAVPAAAVVAEAEVAVVLADAYCRKFGCDSMVDLLGALSAYRERIAR
ncbi:MAG: chorismate synthase [Coriobacteriia bacterium]|nr:chorismate synthase [Coriobacteriia bacterium]